MVVVKGINTVKKIEYSERETRLIISWILITAGFLMFVFWAIDTTGYVRPPLIIDLLFPALIVITGTYMLKKKIPEK